MGLLCEAGALDVSQPYGLVLPSLFIKTETYKYRCFMPGNILLCIDLIHRCANISSVVINPTCRFPGGDAHRRIYSSRKTVCTSTLLRKFRSSLLLFGFVP